MRCPIDFKTLPKDDWPRLTTSIQVCFDELYRQDELRSREFVRSGQQTQVEIPKLVIPGNTSGHKFVLEVNDSNLAAPVTEWRDIGR